MPQVSVIIVCMNRLDNLYPCLTGLKENTSADMEVLVVAYLFSRDNLMKVKEDFPWVTFIESNETRGFSENNNLALKQAQGRYCLVLNDDTEIHTDLVDRLLQDFEKLGDDAAIVSPKLLNADGSLQLLGRNEYPARNYVLQQWHLWAEKKDNVSGKEPVFDHVYRSYNITGACFMIKTDIFRELGWFDETYFFTPEDIALSTLANSKGYGVYVDADAQVIHKWRTTASKMMSATRPAAVRGSLIFFSRGSVIRYAVLAIGVWTAEFTKRIKAALRCAVSPSEENSIKLGTFRNICRSIFTTAGTKEIFTRYYLRLNRKP